jgi:hypothetical protein
MQMVIDALVEHLVEFPQLEADSLTMKHLKHRQQQISKVESVGHLAKRPAPKPERLAKQRTKARWP